MSDLKVSIIVPVYNGERYLRYTLESILRQSYQNIEVIVVDDGSLDDSPLVVKKFSSDPRLQYIRQANFGVAAARNRGANAASGDLLALIDQDDIWEVDKLDKQVGQLRAEPYVALVHCDLSYIDEGGNRIPDPWNEWTTAEGYCFEELFLGNGIASGGALIRKSVFEAVGGFDERRELMGVDDYDLWLRICALHPVARVRQRLLRYRYHPGSFSRNRGHMGQALLLALRKISRLHPDLVMEIPSTLRRQRFCEIRLALARAYAAEGRRMKSFWEAIVSVSLCPGRGFAYREAYRVLVPNRMRNRLAWYSKRIKRSAL